MGGIIRLRDREHAALAEMARSSGRSLSDALHDVLGKALGIQGTRVNTPSVNTPSVNTPSVNTPSVNTPSVNTPSVNTVASQNPPRPFRRLSDDELEEAIQKAERKGKKETLGKLVEEWRLRPSRKPQDRSLTHP